MLTELGDIPSMRGATCNGLIAESFIANGQMVSEINVLYISLNEAWYRLALDSGTIHWRRQLCEPRAWAVSDKGWSYPHVDVARASGLLGQVISGYNAAGQDDGCEVTIQFTNGRSVRIWERGDVVRYAVA